MEKLTLNAPKNRSKNDKELVTLDAKQQEKIGEVLGRCFKQKKTKTKSGDEGKKNNPRKK
jgi:hypothetical protein